MHESIGHLAASSVLGQMLILVLADMAVVLLPLSTEQILYKLCTPQLLSEQ
jgi:hypothetical protein